VIAHRGVRPTLVEWDTDVPAWPDLEAEVHQAQSILDTAGDLDARAA
jgi:hypothetical protein